MIQIGLVLNHVAVSHVYVLLDELVLKILVKSIEDYRESLNCSRSVSNWNGRRNLGNFAQFGHFRPSRKIAHLSWLYCKHITLEGLTLSKFPEVAFNILAHDIVVFSNSACWRRGVLRLFRLFTDRLLIWSLGMMMVMIVNRKFCCHTDACHIFAVGWSHALDGVLDEVLSWDTVTCLAVAIVGMGAA